VKLPWETDRLILRSFKDSDLEPFLAYRNDPDVARYQSWDVPYSRERAIRFIQETQAVEISSRRWLQIAVELKSLHQMIGDVAFSIKPDDARQAAIGYSLAGPYWRNGYAFEAVSRLLMFLFEGLHLHRVVAECDVENVGSWKLLEKVGFRREAHLVEHINFKGVYGSEYHYALLMREWKECHGKDVQTQIASSGA
jgi:RimJ/RimL family protein N-acetyltransferase